MNRDRLIWVLLAAFGLIALAVSFASTKRNHAESMRPARPTPSPTLDARPEFDLSRLPVADYDARLPTDAKERAKRKARNMRYADQGWVMREPHLDDTGVVVRDELPLPPSLPVSESNLVVRGRVTGSAAYLTDDKSGIYSEFTVQIIDVLWQDESANLRAGDCITADRAGGYVGYPLGQQVFYRFSGRGYPRAGTENVFFLRRDNKSPNYEIITAYELTDGTFTALDRVDPTFQKGEIPQLLTMIRQKVADGVKQGRRVT